MSQEKAKEFYELSKNDNELQESLKAADNSATVIQIASEKGYEFTESEWQIVMQEAIAEDELTEKDLQTVAGGLFRKDVDVDSGDTHVHKH